MTKKNLMEDAKRIAMEDVAYYEATRRFLYTLSSRLRRYGNETPASRAANELALMLWEPECDAWRRAFLMGGMSDIKIREAAYERFLSENKAIMGNLNRQGEAPSSWSTDLETEFRKQIAVAFGVEDD